ncbi:MAG: hypothetical protein V7727_18485, partial [Sneathiella sp.]
TFACIVYDSSGNSSQNPKVITATLPDPRMNNAVDAWNEKSDGWLGTKTDCFVNHEKNLEATGAETFDDLPATFAELADTWAEIVTSNSPIVYQTEVRDINTDVTVSPLVAVEASGTYTVKMRHATDAEGADLSALPYTDLSQVSCRYIQFEITVTGTTPLIRDIAPILDGEVLIDDQNDIDTSGLDTATFESLGVGHFKIGVSKNIAAITSAQIVAKQGVGGGWTDSLENKSTTLVDGITPAAEFKLYNSSNVLADALVDVQLKGPKA